MTRPEFVTDEDIVRWSDNVDGDVSVPKVYKDQTIIREVMYAGLWLSEQLRVEGCSETLIPRIQYTMGSLAFGNDIWQTAQDMLQAYKNNDLEFEMDYNEDDSRTD